MDFRALLAGLLAVALPSITGCHTSEAEQHHEDHHKIVVTSPQKRDVVLTAQYVCQIHSRRHIDVCALVGGYLESVSVKEGQAVKQGDLMFKILPTIYEAKLASETAEAQQAQIEFNNTDRLFKQNVVSQQERALVQAKLNEAQAKVQLARAELNFTDIKAPFDGIVDRLHNQKGSLIAEGDVLTTLCDNSVMWVYFNVPEARYLEYMAEMNRDKDEDDADEQDDDDDADARKVNQLDVELVLANGQKFPRPGKIGAIEAEFNNETGNIAFRADFSNPEGLLRHGQTGTILIHHTEKGAIVIPQRATFEILAKQYVYVVDKNGVVHQRDIVVGDVLEDIYLIASGLSVDDKIVLEGIQQVRDGDKVTYEYRSPKSVLRHLKYKAE